MNNYGFTEMGKPSIPGRVVGSKTQQSRISSNNDLLEASPKNVRMDNGLANAPFEMKRQLIYYKDLELYLTAQLQAVKQKIKETEEELNNGNQQ